MDDLLPFLGEIVARSSLVLLAGLGLLFLGKRASASERHLVILFTLLVVGLIPIGVLVSPKIFWTISLPSPTKASSPTQKVTALLLEKSPDALPAPLSPVTASPPSLMAELTLTPIVAVLLAGGMLVQTGMLGRAAWAWRRIRRQAREVSWPEAVLQRARDFLGTEQLPPILVSDEISVPLLAGWWRPVVLLPSGATQWPAERLDMVLCHELAHFRRGDSRWLPLLGAVRVLYWWHPLVWLALARLRREREAACDDLVLQQDFRATDYADLIVITARQALRGPGGALAMASSSNVGERIRAILEPGVNRRAASRRIVWAGLVCALLFGWLVTAAQVSAEETPGDSLATAKPSDANPEIEMSFVMVAIDPKVFSDQKDKLTEAVAHGDITFLRQTQGVSVLILPPLTSTDGVKATFANIQPYRYPVTFAKDKGGHPVPTGFKTRELGLRMMATPVVGADKKTVDVAYYFSLTTLAGSLAEIPGEPQPIFNTRRLNAKCLMTLEEHGLGIWMDDLKPQPPTFNVDAFGIVWEPPIKATPKLLALITSARRVTAKVTTSASAPPPDTAKPQIEMGFQLMEIDSKLYREKVPSIAEQIDEVDLASFPKLPGTVLLSSPRATASIGQEATIQLLKEAPHRANDGTMHMIPLGIETRITPKLAPDGTILLNYMVSDTQMALKGTNYFQRTLRTRERPIAADHPIAFWISKDNDSSLLKFLADPTQALPTPATSPVNLLCIITARRADGLATPAPVPPPPPPVQLPGPKMEVGFTFLEIDDEVYLKQTAAINEALKEGDIDFFKNLPGVTLHSDPKVATGADEPRIPPNVKNPNVSFSSVIVEGKPVLHTNLIVSETIMSKDLDGQMEPSTTITPHIFATSEADFTDGRAVGLWVDESHRFMAPPLTKGNPKRLAFILTAQPISH